MIYSSKFYKDGVQHIYRTDITESEFQEIKNKISNLQNIMNEIDYCIMVRGNILDFIKDSQNNGIGLVDNFARLNRYMMNWLNSFYAWIGYHEKNYKKLFSGIKAKYYDNNVEYRLAYELRKYCTHKAMCIQRIDFDALREINIFQISINQLLADSSLKRIVKEDLQNILRDRSYIDAVKFTYNFWNIFEQLQAEIWGELLKNFQSDISCILKNVQGLSENIYECYIQSNDTKISLYISVSEIIIQFYKKLNKLQIPKELSDYFNHEGDNHDQL